ncbi:Ubiquitin domain-containing protein DSK2a [Abeliophyllum distichum]|uniref:Ubiquitin domain-containing protein DSK2a n=1 Tax=Abeliophyllum distichum TaxID=126358 RepID=A0ABD1W1G2_9LAMI
MHNFSQSWDVPSEQQRLFYKGRILKDDKTLVGYGLQADHTVHMSVLAKSSHDPDDAKLVFQPSVYGSNPRFNPQLHSMLDMNPQLREMMQNPKILRQLTSPETMQQMMALHQLLSQLGQQQSTPERTQASQGIAWTKLPFICVITRVVEVS